MQTLVRLFFFFLIAVSAVAQTDEAAIKKGIQNAGGYEALIIRFQNSDTTLTLSDFKLIYFGYPYQASYKPLETEFNENLIRPYNRAGKYTEAIAIADSILLINPVSLTAHFEKAFACNMTGNTTLEKYHNKRYLLLCTLIKNSGLGTVESPYAVASVNDAMEFLAYTGLQAVNDRKTEKGQIEFELAKNKRKLHHLYFLMPDQAYTAPDASPETE